MIDLNDTPRQHDQRGERSRRREFRVDDLISAFRDAFAGAGLFPPTDIIPDGHWHRCASAVGRQPNTAGSYLLFPDGFPTGLLHNFRTGERVAWHPDGVAQRMTDAERVENDRRVHEAQARREEEIKGRQFKTAADAEWHLDGMVECVASEHEYLARKNVGAYGIYTNRISKTLVYVPMRNVDGKLWGLQEIWPDGHKEYPRGGRVTGNFHTIGKLVDGNPVQIGEGYATGASAFESNSTATIIAFDSGNLPPVAKAIRERYPNSPITILADDDAATAREKGHNPGIDKATEAALAVGGRIAIPDFGPGRLDEQTDFNDLAQATGLDAVREQIEAAKEPQPAPPTYPEPANPLTKAKARERVAEIIDDFVREVLKPSSTELYDFNRPSRVAINAPPGIGKTYAVLARIEDLLNAGKDVVIAVPTHVLGEQLARDLEKNLSARVYRSRDAADPLAVEIDIKMCRAQKRIKAIRGALGDEEKHACKSARGQCVFYETCGFQRQKRNPPKLWIVAHQLLYRNLPKFIPDPDVVIIDEAFHGAGKDRDLKLHLNWLIDNRRDKVAFPDGFEADKNQRLIDISMRAHQALTPLAVAGEYRRIDRQMLEGYLSVEAASEAVEYEWKRKRVLERDYPEERLAAVYPSQDEDEAINNSEARADHNLQVEALATFWEHVRDLLASDLETSLNLYFEPHLLIDKVAQPGIRIMRRSDVHEWVTRCPVLHLDATMNQTVVTELLGGTQFHEVTVRFPATEVVYVEQVNDVINGESSYIVKEIGNNRGRESRFREIRDTVNMIAGWHRGRKVAVICPADLEKALRKTAPGNVALAHYHHLRGRNDLEDVDVLVLAGRSEPPPSQMEADGRLTFRREVTPISPQPGRFPYYPTVSRFMRLRDGTTVRVENHEHPDPGVEALRWLAVEAELIQAIYRARPLNRVPWKPLKVYVLTSVCLPIPVDKAVPWSRMRPSLTQLMLAAKGIATDSPSDAYRLFPDLFKTVKAAEQALYKRPAVSRRLLKRFLQFMPLDTPLGRFIPGERGPADESPDVCYKSNTDIGGLIPGQPTPLKIVLGEIWDDGEWPAAKTLKYRRAGSRANRPSTLTYLPEIHPDPLAALGAALGCEVLAVSEAEDSK